MLGSYATCEKVTPTLRKSVKLDKAKRLLKKDALKKVSLISRFINMTSKDNGKFRFFSGKVIILFQEATCNGKEATCPASLPMADGTKCIDRGECRGGQCVPFCETQDLQVHI